MPTQRGLFILVVGPSGVGKDTLLSGARQALAGDPRYVFPRRCITRPADAGGEDHIAISEAAFAKARDAGRYCLHWQAHGLSYGLPVDVTDALAIGHTVIANVSRGVIAEARQRFAPLRVLSIEAAPAVIAARLAARAREDAAGQDRRLQRMTRGFADGDDVVRFVNEDAPAVAVDAFTGLIRELTAGTVAS